MARIFFITEIIPRWRREKEAILKGEYEIWKMQVFRFTAEDVVRTSDGSGEQELDDENVDKKGWT